MLLLPTSCSTLIPVFRERYQRGYRRTRPRGSETTQAAAETVALPARSDPVGSETPWEPAAPDRYRDPGLLTSLLSLAARAARVTLHVRSARWASFPCCAGCSVKERRFLRGAGEVCEIPTVAVPTTTIRSIARQALNAPVVHVSMFHFALIPNL